MTLYLTIKRIFFEAILVGEKRIEYRERKPYYEKLERNKYDHVKLINGYSSESDFLVCEIERIEITDNSYNIHLGRITQLQLKKPMQFKQISAESQKREKEMLLSFRKEYISNPH